MDQQRRSRVGLLLVGLVVCCLSVFADDFQITAAIRQGTQLIVSFPGNSTSYYKGALSSSLSTGAWSVIGMHLGLDRSMSTTDTLSAVHARFYRIQRTPLTDPGDEDGDGMDDVWELRRGLNPLGAADAVLDLDDDGLSNVQEFLFGTSPHSRDTDQDGLSDGEEAAAGSDPLYNPLQHRLTGLVFSYDDQDRLGSVTSAVSSISMTYDDAGNISTLLCSRGE